MPCIYTKKTKFTKLDEHRLEIILNMLYSHKLEDIAKEIGVTSRQRVEQLIQKYRTLGADIPNRVNRVKMDTYICKWCKIKFKKQAGYKFSELGPFCDRKCKNRFKKKIGYFDAIKERQREAKAKFTKEYQKTERYKARHKIEMAKYYQKNKEKLRERNKKHIINYYKRLKADPEKWKKQLQKYRNYYKLRKQKLST